MRVSRLAYKLSSNGIVAYEASITAVADRMRPWLELIHVRTKTTISAAARTVSTANTRRERFWVRDGGDTSGVCHGDCVFSCSCRCPSSPPSTSCSGSGGGGCCRCFADCLEARRMPTPAENASGTKPTAGRGFLEIAPCATQRGNAGMNVTAVTIRSTRVSAMAAVVIDVTGTIASHKQKKANEGR